MLSPYSVNSLALACVPPALEDTAYLDWYVGEVLQARTEFGIRLSMPQACGAGPAAPILFWWRSERGTSSLPNICERPGYWYAIAPVTPGAMDVCVITIGTREQMAQGESPL